MLDVARALNDMLSLEHVEGVALVGGDHTVLKTGLNVPDRALVQVGVRARQVFRTATPPLRRFDMRFTNGRAVVLPMNGAVLFFRTDDTAELDPLSEAVETHRERLESFARATRSLGSSAAANRALAPEFPSNAAMPGPEREVHPGTAPRSDAAVPAPTATGTASRTGEGEDDLGAVAVAVVRLTMRRVLLNELGAPVLRNYMRKSAKQLEGDHPFLADFRIGLDGSMEPPKTLPADTAAVIEGLGAWLASTIDRCRTLMPDIDPRAVERLAGRHASGLRAHGFFDQLLPTE